MKNLPAVQETPVQFLGWADPMEKGLDTHSSILAWKIPRGHKESDTTEWLSLWLSISAMGLFPSQKLSPFWSKFYLISVKEYFFLIYLCWISTHLLLHVYLRCFITTDIWGFFSNIECCQLRSLGIYFSLITKQIIIYPDNFTMFYAVLCIFP